MYGIILIGITGIIGLIYFSRNTIIQRYNAWYNGSSVGYRTIIPEKICMSDQDQNYYYYVYYINKSMYLKIDNKPVKILHNIPLSFSIKYIEYQSSKHKCCSIKESSQHKCCSIKESSQHKCCSIKESSSERDSDLKSITVEDSSEDLSEYIEHLKPFAGFYGNFHSNNGKFKFNDISHQYKYKHIKKMIIENEYAEITELYWEV